MKPLKSESNWLANQPRLEHSAGEGFVPRHTDQLTCSNGVMLITLNTVRHVQHIDGSRVEGFGKVTLQ
jgi:hypothetical protein